MIQLQTLFQLLRPHQYIKNSFVFIGLVFSHQWNQETLFQSLISFASFCLIASVVYILNDIGDIDADRQHPVKKDRPLASGTISLFQAKIIGGTLMILALFLASLVSQLVVFLITTYFLINVLYTFLLKKIVIVDVFIISMGFMLRILTGTIGLGIEPSQWLLLCGLMLTLFLGFCKRWSELSTILEKSLPSDYPLTREVLKDYKSETLDQFISITATGVIISYGLYTVSPATIAIHHTENLIYTLPFVIYGILRYIYLLHSKKYGSDTAKDLFKDNHLLLTSFLWLIVTFWILSNGQ